jgi:hypothetical protein
MCNPLIRLKPLLTAGLAATLAWSAHAVEIVVKPVAPSVFAHVRDTAGRTEWPMSIASSTRAC